jgi:hypothetical protein
MTMRVQGEAEEGTQIPITTPSEVLTEFKLSGRILKVCDFV